MTMAAGAEHGVRPHLLVSAPHGKEVLWVRPDPLILGKEFAEEGGGAVSHPDGQPGSACARGHAGKLTR